MCAASLLVVFIFISSAFAVFTNEQEAQRKLDEWRPRLEKLESALKQPDLSDTGLAGIKSELEKLRQKILGVRNKLQPALKKLDQQYLQLGPKPKDGGETEEIAKKRNDLEKILGSSRGLIKQLDVAAVRAGQIIDTTAVLQRTNFTTRVLTSNRSVLNPGLWLDGIAQFKTFWERISRTVDVGLKSVQLSLSRKLAVIVLIAALASWFFSSFLRLKLALWLGRNPSKSALSLLETLWRVTRTPLVNCISAILTFAIIAIAIDLAGFKTLRLKGFYDELFKSILVYVLISSLTYGVLSPQKTDWRLPNLSDRAARTLKRCLDLLGLYLALDLFFTYVSSALFMPVQFAQAQSAIGSIFFVIVATLAMMSVSNSETDDSVTQPASGLGHFEWVEKWRNILWLIIIATGFSLLTGHLSLAQFLSQTIISTSVLVTIFYLLHCLVDEILTTGLQPEWFLGKILRKTLKFSEAGISRIAMISGTAFDFILLFIGVPMIISLWALTWIDWNSWVSKIFFGVQIGGVNISLSVVLIAAGVFFGTIAVTRLLTRWLDTRVLSRTTMNRGVKDSIKTAMGYSGFIIATLFAISFTGLDFSKVAIVAGALSVGIGFGLQSVVNNFVSGLILLVERPIKVGDWIVVSSGEGYVKNIKVRSTEIETFDRATIIVPNSSLISDSVQNWTHSNTIGRIRILVGVSYGADPRQVEEILMQIATDNKEILSAPAPWVMFRDFGASSLDFELRAYLGEVERVYRVSSILRFEIFDALKAANIEIPFPQRDINFRDMDKLENILKSKNDVE